ncbi:MAG: ABC transporter ATP-binding protein [Planctomycetes bacterium]|nr:ABC transporter ATP-binding protein [Planctomycetota bacterium]
MSADAVQFRDVSFTYRGDWLQRIRALERVDLRVPAGSAFGYLGANGAGKSTSIKLLVGLLQGHLGEIRLFGDAIGAPRLRARLGYLPEQPFFYENLGVGEYLRYLGKLSGLSGSALDQACDRVYGLLDLGDLRERRLGSFSKGMRQRFGLAQAILHSPDLLLLDEPFSGLDPLWRARFKDIMAGERRRGATLLFSTHILSDVEDLCDHFAVIDHGVVLEQGRLADLLGSAPLALTASGPRPENAVDLGDGSWRLVFPEHERERRLAESLAAGASIVRLERQRIALEDHFVAKVREFHAAGSRLGGSSAERPS